MPKRVIPFGVVKLCRTHSDDSESCFCEVVTIYTSQATGRKMTLHRTWPQQAFPPPGTIAVGKLMLDAEDWENPADHG